MYSPRNNMLMVTRCKKPSFFVIMTIPENAMYASSWRVTKDPTIHNIQLRWNILVLVMGSRSVYNLGFVDEGCLSDFLIKRTSLSK